MSAGTYNFEAIPAATKKITAEQHTAQALHTLHKLIKPILRCLKKRHVLRKTFAEIQQNAYNASLEDMRKDTANDDNLANEKLEQCIYKGTQTSIPTPTPTPAQTPCPAARFADEQYPCEEQQQQQQPNETFKQFIPVHFVRTNSGTYFWTSTDLSRDQELVLRARFDRWGQA